MKLIIVESPHKSETISHFLGKDYKVLASKGHIDDLSNYGPYGFGVDVDNNFAPRYILDRNKKDVVNNLKNEMNKASEVILASDPDREGEAIAYHLARVLNLDLEKTKRIKFNEITKTAIINALENPQEIDVKLVNAQETRRIIDRVVGFRLSGILQRKLKSRSAGRVQSATLKLIADHDKEVEEFVPEEYWTLTLDLKNDNKQLNVSYYPSDENKKIKNKEECDSLTAKLIDEVTVSSINKSTKTIESKPIFSTSTLQIEAFNALKFTTLTTTTVAQKLYEGVEINGQSIGLISYPRTDSVRLNDDYVKELSAFIISNYGKEYLGRPKYKKIKGAQDAHAGIYPTSISLTPDKVKPYLTSDQYRLYKLIYNRTVASLMKGRIVEIQDTIFDCGGVNFKTEGKKTVFDGYTKIYKDEENGESEIINYTVGEKFKVVNVNTKQEFTKAPPYYSEGRIVKLMEDKGIGRPSTYSSTIQTLKKRGYIATQNGLIVSTDTGRRTIFVLTKYFPNIVSTDYTAQMELKLDDIENGSISELEVLKSFYYPFMDDAASVEKIMYADDDEPVGRNCPVCGAPLVYKKSKYGRFVGCSKFPECNYVETEEKEVENVGRTCPKCGKPLVYRYNKRHVKFIGCSDYPKCKYIENIESEQKAKLADIPTKKICPDCGAPMVIRHSKTGRKFYACTNFPKCKHAESLKKKRNIKKA